MSPKSLAVRFKTLLKPLSSSFQYMKSKILLLSLLTLLVTSSDFDTFEHVLRLTTDNFSEQLAKHEQIMVMFYKPACPHSRNFGPEYNDAAEELKTSNNPIPLAIINIDEKKSFQDYHKINRIH